MLTKVCRIKSAHPLSYLVVQTLHAIFWKQIHEINNAKKQFKIIKKIHYMPILYLCSLCSKLWLP